MKSFNKSSIAVLVFGVVFTGVMSGAHAQAGDVLSTLNGTDSNGTASNFNVRGNYGVTYNLQDTEGHLSKLDAEKADVTQVNGVASMAIQNKVDNSINKDAIDNVNADLQANKTLFSAGIHTAQDTANTALAASGNAQITADNNAKEIHVVEDQTRINSGLISTNDTRITKLENAPKPKNGVDGKDGATGAQGVAGLNGRDGKDGSNGVTTTVTQVKVDTATQAKVDSNSQVISSTAQDLQAAKQTMQAMNNTTNQQFKSLRDEVDSNKKQANAGISGAMAMAGLPQVQTNQRVMFSAGGATYNGESALAVGASVNFNSHVITKVSFSDDTSNNMGASVGVGIGF